MVVIVGLVIALGGVGGAWAYMSVQAQGQLAEVAQTAGLTTGDLTIGSVLQSLSAAIGQLKEQVRTLEGQLAANEASIESLNQELLDRNLQIANLTATINALEGGASSELDALRGQLSTVEQERDSLQAQIVSLQAEKTSLDAQLAALEAQVATLETENASLTSQIAPLQAQVTDLQAIVALQKRTVVVNARTLVTSSGEALLLHTFNVTNAGYVKVTGSATTPLSVIRITTSYDMGGEWTFTCDVEVSANCLVPALPGTVRIEWQPDLAYPVGQATLTAEWVY